MNVKVIAPATLTINGSSYSADVPVAQIDDGGWFGASTSLNVTGLLTDSGATFIAKLKTAASTWNVTLGIQETMQAKLDGLVGKIL